MIQAFETHLLPNTMPSAAEARSFNASYQASTASSSASRPVAVVVGGTSGVGAATATSLTSVFNGNIDVYVIGRNQARGQAVLDGLALPSASASSASSQDESKLGKPVRDFIPCDVWLMRDVARATNELKTTKGVEKINYLVLTPGMMTMQGRTESDEGIDQKMAVHYYGRWKFAYE
jgi:NAD(P)-dependent dehydrogenase (short-subunit alcohol dehydrogenase family)